MLATQMERYFPYLEMLFAVCYSYTEYSTYSKVFAILNTPISLSMIETKDKTSRYCSLILCRNTLTGFVAHLENLENWVFFLLKIQGKPGKTREILEILHLLREIQGKCFYDHVSFV